MRKPLIRRHACLIALVGVALVYQATAVRASDPGPLATALVALDSSALAERLAPALRFRTVSEPQPGFDAGPEFIGLHNYLARTFPLAHARLRREVVNGYSLLYTWPGMDAALPAVALLGHQDVVPADDSDGSQWAHPPFAGVVADGYVWGRGAMDDKLNVLGLLKACEHLLRSGYEPRRTVLFAFGHDEEVHGQQGAARIAEMLESRGNAIDFVLDEGGIVAEGLVPGVTVPVAVVSTAEKGAATVELSVRNTGPAHSSSPARQTPVGILARALVRIEEHPAPTRLVPPVRAFIEHLAPETAGVQRLALSNLWLFEPLVRHMFTRNPATNALVRTTAVGTMLSGSPKENVIPEVARAVVNVRILPGDTAASALDFLRRTIDDERVQVQVLYEREPSPSAPIDSPAFALVRRTIIEVFPDALVTPILATGGTDARYYAHLTPNVFRFQPVRAGIEELRRAHGLDERIAITAYADAVRFYTRLIVNATGATPP